MAYLADGHYRCAYRWSVPARCLVRRTSYGFTVVSTIYAVAPRTRVLWGGTSGGITGVHEWVFSETPTGVHVTTNESFAGEPVEADVTGMQSALDSSLISWLAHLKAAAESKS